MPSPAIVSQETYAALVEAVHPSSAEVLRVKDALRARLADGAADTHELENSVAEVMGLPPFAHREDPYDVHPDVPLASRIDRDATPIKRVRIRHAAKLALAELAAEGVIVPAETRSNDHVSVPVHQRGHSGAERFDVVTPRLAAAYVTTPGKNSLSDPPMLDATSFNRGLGGLLDPRAARCLEEALTAARRGLYLSAVNLLGAVSEAAWYRIGEAFAERDDELSRALADNQTGQVLRLVVKQLSTERRARSMASELHSHAAYLRDLRNYGVHPRQDQDPGQEQAFTETGCLLLIMQVHRYLARLVEAATFAGAVIGGSERQDE